VLLQLSDELVEHFLHGVLFVAALIFREIAVFFLLFDLVDRIAAEIAKCHLALFGVFGGQLAELLTTFLRERRHIDPDHLAVVVGCETQFTHGNGLFDRGQSADVEGLDLDGLGVRR